MAMRSCVLHGQPYYARYNQDDEPWRNGPASDIWQRLRRLGAFLHFGPFACIPDVLMQNTPPSCFPVENLLATCLFNPPRPPVVPIPSAEYPRYLHGRKLVGLQHDLPKGFPYGYLEDDNGAPNLSALPDDIEVSANVNDDDVSRGAFDPDGIVTCCNHLLASTPLGSGDDIPPPFGVVLRYAHNLPCCSYSKMQSSTIPSISLSTSQYINPRLFTYLDEFQDMLLVVSVEAMDRDSAAAALWLRIQPSLKLLILILNITKHPENDTHPTLPPWAFILGYGYYQNTVCAFAHFPWPSITERSVEWTGVSVYLGDRTFMRRKRCLSTISLMVFLARLRRYSSELARQTRCLYSTASNIAVEPQHGVSRF